MSISKLILTLYFANLYKFIILWKYGSYFLKYLHAKEKLFTIPSDVVNTVYYSINNDIRWHLKIDQLKLYQEIVICLRKNTKTRLQAIYIFAFPNICQKRTENWWRHLSFFKHIFICLIFYCSGSGENLLQLFCPAVCWGILSAVRRRRMFLLEGSVRFLLTKSTNPSVMNCTISTPL